MKRLWRHVAFNWNEGGFRQVLYKIGFRLRKALWSCEEWLIFSTPIRQCDFSPQMPALERRSVGFDELQQLGYEKVLAFPEVIQERFEAGDRCFAYFLHGEVTAFLWLSERCLKIVEGVRIDRADVVGVYDTVTLPPFRGRGIHREAIRMLLRAAAEGPETEAITAIEPGHTRSIRGFEHLGFRVSGRIRHTRRLGLSFVKLTPERRAPQVDSEPLPATSN